MNRMVALLVAFALFSPVFAGEAKVPVKKAEIRKVHTRKQMAKRQTEKKKPVLQSSALILRNPDFPWQTPT
jgi:hypothetical protein